MEDATSGKPGLTKDQGRQKDPSAKPGKDQKAKEAGNKGGQAKRADACTVTRP